MTASDAISLSEDLSGADYYCETVLVPTTWTAISLNNLASLDILMIHNTDDTNYIELASDAAGAHKFSKVAAGRANLISPSGNTIYAKANTAACLINVTATEP